MGSSKRQFAVGAVLVAACSGNHAAQPTDGAIADGAAVDSSTACTDDSQCPGGSGDPFCVSGTCVQCRSSADCAATTPVCASNACRGCLSNAECASGLCDVATGTCDDFGSGDAMCDPILQVGCAPSSPRCTWIEDSVSSGHVGCVAAGSAALGATCTGGSSFPSFDDCDAGGICIGATCEAICDNNAVGSACGSGFACGLYSGLFQVGGSFEAGACDRTCDPIADNSFGSAGDSIPPRTGSSCGSDQGCYGFPSSDPTHPTQYTCSLEVNPSLVHRSECGAGCSPGPGSVYLNGCAQGYLPLLDDGNLGSTNAVCIAYCIPQDCYAGSGNCGSDGLADQGLAPHQCIAQDIRLDPSYTPPTADLNSCMYSWVFEQDAQGAVAESPTSNTVGFCFDHSLYRYDSNGNGMIDSGDAFVPPCDELPGSGSDINAATWGCVSTTTAQALGDLAPRRPLRDLPRMPAAISTLRDRAR